MNLYRNETSNAKYNAQRNLSGRTHYVDDDTLRFHHSRVLSSRNSPDGLLFYIVTSDALDMHNSNRGYRGTVFNVFGDVVYRPRLDESFTTSEKASKAMYAALDLIDAKAVTLAAIEQQSVAYAKEMESLRATVQAIGTKKAA